MADNNNITGIAPALAGIFIPIVLFVLVFDKERAWILVPIAFAFAILGIGVAYFASKVPRKK
jgi:VIT1/CCC1 family predicted Fe2+/Mn2+ transporter